MKKIVSLLLFFVVTFGFKARADEGMWLLPLIEKLNIGTMTEMGLKLSAEDIYSINQASLKDAIAIFDGGCTAEIVSPEGLMLTNHHCGYDRIQEHSSLDHDYLKDGFWAMSRDEELPNPGLSVIFLVSIKDVTERMLANVNNTMGEEERYDILSAERSKILEEAMEGNGHMAEVESFYGGNYFYLLEYDVYSDVRLVGAPPSSIGKFGSDTDNWEWPRHTGDFSVFRVYMSPDGKPAEYSEDNVPLKPKYWLPVSIKELNQDDFAMILGYPGFTQRYYTSYEVDEIMKIVNPNRIKIRGIKQDVWMADMMADQKVNIQYAAKYSNSSNYWKNAIGQNEQLERLNVIEKKIAIEDQFRAWISEDPEREERYGEALDLIKNSIEARADYENSYQYLSECIGGCEIFSLQRYGRRYMNAIEIDAVDMLEDIKATAVEAYKDYSPSTDRKSMKAMLKLYREDIDSRFWPDFYTEIVDKKFKGDIDRYVDYIFDKSFFASEERALAFMEKPSAKILEKDPAYIFALSINNIAQEIYDELVTSDDDLARGQRLWIAALREMMPDKTQYPDANFTMRLSYGSIKEYDPKDAVTYKYYTTLQGVIDKYIPGDYEFDLPRRLIDLNNKREFGRYGSDKGYMPVNFLTTNDITGGNSGSPILNGNGELIGLAFDGNWEAMSGDFMFEPDLQRTIAVDIRYVLWIMDIYSGAGHLVNEMTIVE